MKDQLELFNLKKGDIVSITGCGGKTTLMFYLAKILAKKGKVLVTTTTKIYLPQEKDYEKLVIGENTLKGQGHNIHIRGEMAKGGKLLGLKEATLKELITEYDYLLIEADGSRGKKLKGWNQHEPAIPSISNKTIGVINIKSIGLEATPSNIHRLEIFLDNTKVKQNQVIGVDTLDRYIETSQLFKNSRGENYLYINGIEGNRDIYQGLLLANKRKNVYLGSLHQGWLKEYKGVDAVVMASGYGRRFGSNKLLAEVEEKKLLEYTLEVLKNIPFKEIYLVGRSEEVKKLSKEYGYTYLANKRAHLGQSESIKLALKESTSEGVMFFTGDQPFLQKKTIIKLLEVFEKTNKITRPIVSETPSTPVIFPRSYREELLTLEGDCGGSMIIKKYPNRVEDVEFLDAKEFVDIDTRADLNNFFIKGS